MSISPFALASLPPRIAVAEMEAYYTSVNPTPGTGLATIAAQASLVDTAPFLMVIAGATRSVYLDYLKLTCTAPGTAGTALRYAVKTDSAKAAPAGGSTLTPVNTTGLSQVAAAAAVYAGPLTAAAAVAARLVSHGMVRPVIPVIGDSYLFKFGGNDPSIQSAEVPAGTAITDRLISLPPVIVRPTGVAQFHIWLPSQSAASSYEVELGFFEF